MAFEVPPSPVGTRRFARPTAAFVLVLGVVVSAAVLNREPAPAAAPSPVPVAAAQPSAAPPTQPSPLPSPVPTPGPTRTLPPHVACRQIDAATCQAMARAALALLTPGVPAVTTVTVYRSLLCDNDQDCPPARLARSRQPWGSVVVDFSDGSPPAWINVVTPAASSQPPAFEAWIIDRGGA